jgi:cell division septation protein DedD
MRVTCPKCECKGLIDTAPLLSKARVVCVRCGTAYDALLVDGKVETAPIKTVPDAHGSSLEASAQPAECAVLVEPDEVLALPQAFEHKQQVNEPIILDFTNPAEGAVQAQPSTAFTAAPAHSVGQQMGMLPVHEIDPLAESGEFEMPEEHLPQLSREALERHGESDKYGMGVRLMRVSPLWLLVCGLSFIALVIALNSMTGAAVQVNNASSHMVQPSVTGNQATNRSVSSQRAHTPSEVSTRSEKTEPTHQDMQPTPAGTQHEDTPPMPPVAGQNPSAKQEPVLHTSIAEPAHESPPQSPTQPDSTGRFTLQVGSYNNPVEANEHAARLQGAGFTAQVVAVDLPKRGIWYRVMAGSFNEREDAARYGAQLRAKGVAESFIISDVSAH